MPANKPDSAAVDRAAGAAPVIAEVRREEVLRTDRGVAGCHFRKVDELMDTLDVALAFAEKDAALSHSLTAHMQN